uniref:Uncharacterized protein n=1 Tax=Caenorhabditis japonica TaxID=281687 RepID=A0A8R1I8B3_CAEJA
MEFELSPSPRHQPERRWSIFLLDHEESHASPRRSVSPSPEIVYTVIVLFLNGVLQTSEWVGGRHFELTEQ